MTTSWPSSRACRGATSSPGYPLLSLPLTESGEVWRLRVSGGEEAGGSSGLDLRKHEYEDDFESEAEEDPINYVKESVRSPLSARTRRQEGDG